MLFALCWCICSPPTNTLFFRHYTGKRIVPFFYFIGRKGMYMPVENTKI